MHKTHARLVTLMILKVTEVTENNKEIPVAKSRLILLQKSLRRYVKRYHGELVEVSFGEIYAYFPGANLAYKAARDLPVLLPQFNIRIGLHMGELLFRQEKPQGAGLNFASRLPALARAGGVCLSQSVHQYLNLKKQQALVALGTHDLKNVDSQVELYAYLPKGQKSRRKTREFFRRFKAVLNLTKLRVIFSISIVLILSLVLSSIWKQTESQGRAVGAMLEIYMPGFSTVSMAEADTRLLAGIEMAVKAAVAGNAKKEGTSDVILVTDQNRGQMSVYVALDVNGDQLRSTYRILASDTNRLIDSGEISGNRDALFQFEDRLASLILSDLLKRPKHKPDNE